MTAATLHDSRASWIRLGISLAIATAGNVGMWSIIVIMPAVEAEFALGRGQAALPYTLTMLGFALGNVVIGRWVDRFGITAAVTAAGAGLSLAYAGAALAPTAMVLAALQFAIGFGTAVSFGPLIADISHWFLRRRGIAVAIAACGNYLSGAIWPMLLAGVLAEAGWRTAYLTIAAVLPFIMIPLAQLLRARVDAAATARAEAHAAAAARGVRLSPRAMQILLGFAGIGCCVAMSMPQVHIVAYSTDLGYGAAAGAEMLSLMLAGGVVSRLVSGLIADRLGGVRTLLLGSTLQMLALILYLPSDAIASLYAVSLIFGLAQGGIVPSYALIVREYMPAREAGARVGFVIMATILGMALGGWLSGAIYELTGSYAWAFVNGIAWNAVNIAIMLGILAGARPRLGAPAPGGAAP